MTTRQADDSSRIVDAAKTNNEPDSRYSEFLRNSTLGIWCVELEKPISIKLPLEEQIDLTYKYGFLSEANDMMAKMYGLSSGKELVGTRLTDMLPKDDPENQEYLKNFFSSGYKLHDGESSELDTDGNKKYFLNSLTGIVENGMLQGAWGTQLDITNLHETTDALGNSEAKLALALEASGAGMWEWNKAEDTLHWSEKIKSLFGVPSDFAVTPKKYFSFIHPDDLPTLIGVIKQAMKDRKGFDLEHRIIWPDGSEHWLLCRGQTFYEGRKAVRILGTCMNIDERKAAEDLRLRSSKLDEERQKLLDLNSSKDEFIALASHQLRTPATSVKQYLGILLEGVLGDLNLSEDQMKALTTAYDNNERQINIVNDLLLVATIDAGKMKLHTRPVNIGDLVRTIMKDSRSEHKDRTYELIIKEVDEPIVVLCDRERVRMALENVISNAFKYSPDSSLVTVEIARHTSDAVVRVTDRGVGIDTDDMSRLFQKFSRIKNTLSITSGGTGLGLYWTEKIIKLHNGSIKVTSQPGKKTVFTISLPL